jgi:hypothetical protein
MFLKISHLLLQNIMPALPSLHQQQLAELGRSDQNA